MTELFWGTNPNCFRVKAGSLGTNITANTDGNTYRLPNRCSVQLGPEYAGRVIVAADFAAPATSFWTTVRFGGTDNSGYPAAGPAPIIQFLDAGGLPRLEIISPLSTSVAGPLNVNKIDAAGTRTLLFTTSDGLTINAVHGDKFDIYVNYMTTGALTVYKNGNIIGACTNTNITTNGVTQLVEADFSQWLVSGYNQGKINISEVIVRTTSTLAVLLNSKHMTGIGPLNQWGGTVAEVGGLIADPSQYDSTATANQVELWSAGGTFALPPGAVILGVMDVLVCTAGTGTLAHIAPVRNIGGTTYIGGTLTATVGGFGVQRLAWGPTNPATGLAWTPANMDDATIYSGYKSLA